MEELAKDRISENKPPIFIIGSGRSGTTLLRYMLNAHPNIYILEETFFYINVSAKKNGNEIKRVKKFLKSYCFAWLRIPAKTISEAAINSSGDKIRQAYLTMLSLKTSTYGRKRYGEKCPPYTMFLNRILKDFPDAPIINMIRDPRGQIFSHTTMPFSTPSLTLANLYSRLNYKAVSKYKNRILSIRLEDLIHDPKATMGKVLQYINEPWSDNVLEHQKHLLYDDGIPFPWLKEASHSRRTKKKKWSDTMTPAWIRITERWQRQTFKEFGYQAAKLDREPSFMNKFLAILLDISIAILWVFWIIIIFTRVALTDKKNLFKIQNLWCNVNPRAWSYHKDWDRIIPKPPTIQN